MRLEQLDHVEGQEVVVLPVVASVTVPDSVVVDPPVMEPLAVEALGPPPSEQLHDFVITGMAIAALIGIGALLASIAIAWPGDTRRVPISIFVLAGVAFMICATLAVFSAARESVNCSRQNPPNG